MPILTIRHVAVTGAKADFVKHSIRVTLDLPLTDENLGLRSKLAWLAMEKESVTITLESAQLPLFDDAPKSANDIAADFIDEVQAQRPRVTSVTLSTKDHSVTLDENTSATADAILRRATK